MRRLLIAFLLTILNQCAFTQVFNNNPEKFPVNIPLPKTPEAQAFQKYGDIPVNEFTGVPQISIPIYAVKSKFLGDEIQLNYHPSGIRVNQEATWVGLGFDLMSGGKITVETKGNVDERRRGFTNVPRFKAGLRRLFNRMGPSHFTSLMGYGFLNIYEVYSNAPRPPGYNDTLFDDNYTVSHAAWRGIAEPDIYHASFLGKSVSFYVDLITDQVKQIGEKSLYSISINRNAQEYIDNFVITDNSGLMYYFEQKETTTVIAPPAFETSIYTSTTSWLLTKITHPNGDQILYSYTNFGKSHPAFSWGASISMTYPDAGIASMSTTQNKIEQDAYYLTRIETHHTYIDFLMSAREDLRGEGARKLDTIRVSDKFTGRHVRKIAFNYDYFVSAATPEENGQPSETLSYYRKRLKLLSLVFCDSSNNPTYKFFYTNNVGVHKLSFSQDHWGYYNGVNNRGYLPNVSSPLNLLPKFDEYGSFCSRGIGMSILPCLYRGGVSPGAVVPAAFNGFAFSRHCSPHSMTAMMMDSIEYPTGGSTRYEFEPHVSYSQNQSIVGLVGGGLRVKSIKHYSFIGKLENKTEYKYEEADGGRSSGIYLGLINYVRISNKQGLGTSVTLSSSGEINSGSMNVGYRRIKKIRTDKINQSSGATVSHYYLDNPYMVEYKSAYPPFYTGGFDPTGVRYLFKEAGNIPPTPYGRFEGKLFRQEEYNRQGQLVKSTDNYYSRAAFTQELYSLTAEDNYSSGIGELAHGVNDTWYGCDNGNQWRRWSVTVHPAKAYFTLLDSTKEKTYSNQKFIEINKTFRYNKYHQLEYECIHNSDQSQTIKYTRTAIANQPPNYPVGPTGDAYFLNSLISSHIYDLPVEQVDMRRLPNGDTVVTGAVFMVYQGLNKLKSFRLALDRPSIPKANFQPLYYHYAGYPGYPNPGASYVVVPDNKYKIEDSMVYSGISLPVEYFTKDSRKSFIWDNGYATINAQCINATSSQIAYTSFETAAKGNWDYTAPPISGTEAFTGKHGFDLSGKQITKGDLDPARSYFVSYWAKGGVKNVSNSTYSQGEVVEGWTYFEHRVTNPALGVVTVSGSGQIDELRLHPVTAQMHTYTHEPLVGINSQCDPGQKVSYYEYDKMGRLLLIRDRQRNILKKFGYQFLAEPYSKNVFYSITRSRAFRRTNCGECYIAQYHTYEVPAGKHYSIISQSDADQKAENDLNTNGQAYANEHGECIPDNNGCLLIAASNWQTNNSHIYEEQTTATAFFSIYPKINYASGWSSAIHVGSISCFCKPSATRVMTVQEISNPRTWEVTVEPNGNVYLKIKTGSPPGAGSNVDIRVTYNL